MKPRLSDAEVDRLVREALGEDLPAGLEGELRREARLAWDRAGSRRAWWPARFGLPTARRPFVPQAAAAAAAVAMLGAGAVMQAAPAPPGVVESFQGRQAAALTARALGRAAAMDCVLEVADGPGRQARYRVDWRSPGESRVRLDGEAGTAEWALRLPGAAPTVLTHAAARRDDLAEDPALQPARSYLSPAALGERLGAPWRPLRGYAAAPGTEAFRVRADAALPGLTVVVDAATHLPVRLDGTDRDGRAHAVVCRWP